MVSLIPPLGDRCRYATTRFFDAMQFTNRFIVRHFGVRHTPGAINVDMADGTQVELRPIRDDEIKDSYAADDWVAKVCTDENVSDKVTEQFRLLPDERRPAVDEVTTRVGRRIHDSVDRTLRLCRWRTGVHGHHESIRCTEKGLQWSTEGTEWRSAGGFRIESLGAEVGAVPFNEAVWDEVGALTRSGADEPVAHELLREAWNVKFHSARSSLILGVSALEVGVKEFISDLVPNSEWLCFEVPSPPVVRILQEYLPKIPVRAKLGGEVFIPPVLTTEIKKLITKRNRITHRGVDVELNSSLTDSLSLVQATLYLLDFYRGHIWAINNIRDTEVCDLIRERLKK